MKNKAHVEPHESGLDCRFRLDREFDGYIPFVVFVGGNLPWHPVKISSGNSPVARSLGRPVAIGFSGIRYHFDYSIDDDIDPAIFRYALEILGERFRADRRRFFDELNSGNWQEWPSTSFKLFETAPELGGKFLIGNLDEDALVGALAQLLWEHRHDISEEAQQIEEELP